MLRMTFIVPLRLVNHSRPINAYERKLMQHFYGSRLSAAGKNFFNIYNPERI